MMWWSSSGSHRNMKNVNNNVNLPWQRNWNKAFCSFLFSECRGLHRLNTSEVSPCGDASSRWSSEECVFCVNAMVVWIAIAGLCVKLAQGRDRNSLPLITYSHSYRANPQEHNSETQLSHILSLLPGVLPAYKSKKDKKPCTIIHLCNNWITVNLNY